MDIIVGIDLESTGNDPEKDRIIEMALVAIDASTKATLFKFEQRYNPEINISSKASQVHGIANADVMKCPLFASKAPQIALLLKKAKLLVAHNGDEFDVPLLMNELTRVGQEYPSAIATFDTMKQGRWATPDGKYPTLGELCWSLNIPYDKSLAHSALYDTDVLMQAYIRGLGVGVF